VEIFDRIKAVANSVELSNNDYKFDTLDNAVNYFDGHKQYELKITASKPYLVYTCGRHGNDLYIGADPSSAQLFLDLNEITQDGS
jgi:hypothetical protein